MVIFIILYLALMVFFIASIWKINVKAGQPGWACLVPIYNIIILLKIADKPWWWMFLMCIPIVNIIIIVMVYHNVSLNFGKTSGFTAGLVLLSPVFIPILAFGDSVYKGGAAANNGNDSLDAA